MSAIKDAVIKNKRLLFISGLIGLIYDLMHSLGRNILENDKSELFVFGTWLKVIAVFPLFFCIVAIGMMGMHKLKQWCVRWEPGHKGQVMLYENPQLFVEMWLLFFVSWIPCFLASYPGIYSYDSQGQMEQVAIGKITAHHPIIHTFFMKFCFGIGQHLFQSNQAGMAIYSIFQMLILSGIFSYGIRYMVKRKCPTFFVGLTILFFALFPVNQLFAVVATKDTVFAGVFLLFFINVCEMARCPEDFFFSAKKVILFIITTVIMFMWRNNGYYIFLIFIPFLFLWYKKFWKQVLCICLSCIVIWQVYTGPFYHYLKIEKGSVREMLSVPIQQFARTYKENEDTLTCEEKHQILELIPENIILDYNSHISDPVKDSFNIQVLAENTVNYGRLWIKLCCKYTEEFVDAFLATNFGVWYPWDKLPDDKAFRPYFEYYCRSEGGRVNIRFEPKLPALHQYYNAVSQSGCSGIPIIFLLFSSGFQIWIMLFLLGVAIADRQKKYYIIWIPLLALWVSVLLGPVGVLRYIYPVIVALPVAAMTVLEKENSASAPSVNFVNKVDSFTEML